MTMIGSGLARSSPAHKVAVSNVAFLGADSAGLWKAETHVSISKASRIM